MNFQTTVGNSGFVKVKVDLFLLLAIMHRILEFAISYFYHFYLCNLKESLAKKFL